VSRDFNYCSINRITVGKKEVSNNIKIRVPITVYVPTLLYDSRKLDDVNKKHDRRFAGTEIRHLGKCTGKTRKELEIAKLEEH
jgi:hypothetical protein